MTYGYNIWDAVSAFGVICEARIKGWNTRLERPRVKIHLRFLGKD